MAASISKLFTLGRITAGGGGEINQIESHSFNPAIQEIVFNADGLVDPQYVSILSSSPMLRFATSAIARALTAAGISGLAISGTAVDAYFQKYAQGGVLAGGGTSVKVSIGYGLICPRTLTWGHNTPAVLNYEVWARTNDGSTAPLAVTASATMPAVSAADQLFTAGPVSINGSALEGVQGGTIDFGLNVIARSGSGVPYPEFLAIQQRQPTISLRSTHLDWPTESGMGLYVAQSATDSVIYLRKLASGGVRVADATTQHISFTIDEGMVIVREDGASQGGGGGMIELELRPVWDGTAAIIAINTATAIS